MLVLSACKKEDDRAFEEAPDVRVEKTLTAFQQELSNATNGWKAVIYPKGGRGFSYWMKFNKENRVVMVSDFNTESATTPKTSSYRLKALQQPSLLFDTYNYIHLPADPNGSISGGSTSTGLASDFEFMLGAGLIDTLNQKIGVITQLSLTGRFNGVTIKMTKATAAEETAYNAAGLNALIVPVSAYISANKYLFLKLADNKQLQVSIDVVRKNFSLAWDANGAVSSSVSPFAFTLTGIVLQTPVEYNGKKIYELTWDDHAQVLYATVDGVKVIIEVSPSPILPLHLMLGGTGSTTVTAPNATTFPGWSADFQARRAQAAAAMLAGGYNLRMDRMLFAFNSSLKTMLQTTDIYQGASKFVATFSYTYTKTPAGLFRFIKADPYANGNGAIIVGNMAPLLAQRLDADQFTVDYFVDPVNGILAQFKSVEHPDFTFTGTIQ